MGKMERKNILKGYCKLSGALLQANKREFFWIYKTCWKKTNPFLFILQ